MINRDPFAVVIYTDWLPKIVNGGVTLFGFLIFIRPKYRNDYGLLQHELMHVRQGLRMLLYRFEKYRLQLELEAYREQLRWSIDKAADADIFAGYLAENYGLSISKDEARRLLFG